ncbi:MAG: hypothetical protein ACM3X7_07680 [Solirubrobacterales bacterium]
MISEKEYHSMISKLPKQTLPDDFENNVMKTLKLDIEQNTSSKPLYGLCCTVLSIFLGLMIFTSTPVTKETYANVGENVIFVGNQLFNSVISSCMLHH